MGPHIIFIIFHVVAWFTIKYLLILTIGLHLLYATTSRNLEKQTELLKEQTELMKGKKPEPEPEPIPLNLLEWFNKNVIWIILFGAIFAMIGTYIVNYTIIFR